MVWGMMGLQILGILDIWGIQMLQRVWQGNRGEHGPAKEWKMRAGGGELVDLDAVILTLQGRER